ncbi:MAG: protein-disulfide reductase DsbD family protein [Chthoniobacterales bacterium]
MRASRSFGLWLLLVAALSSFAITPSRAQVYGGRELVNAQLISNSTAVVPGKPFRVGLLLRMAPGWHTYWKFPGDAGIPTELKWKLSPDWKIGEIQWPTALRISEPGDIDIYGYHDEVLLTQEITPPTSLGDAPATLSTEANWLVCEKICIPGGTQLQLELPIAPSAAPANEELFARAERSLPQPWPANDVAAASWSRAGNDLVLHVQSKVLASQPIVEFHPLPPAAVVVGHPATERDPDGVTFRIPVETTDASVSSIPGVVVFGRSADAPDRSAWSLSGAAVMAAAIQPVVDFRLIAKFLLFGFIGGFILNLMPCVLPVISLKIFGFIQHAGQSRRRIFRSGLSFVAGIFVWFIGLALLLIALKSAGHVITWAFQFTNPYFVLAMSVLVLVFALNLFGVFELSLPQSANRGLLGWSSREGDAGSFFQGIFATILATPCTAPFLGTALGFAFTQSGWLILLMFVAIAAGMSAPYLLLSAQPGWLKFLPKPGAWMERVKQLMGFLLMATLLFLLSVLGAQRGLSAVIWTSCFLLVVSVACWMKGAFITPLASVARRAFVVVLMLALVFGSGAYFIGAKFAAAAVDPVVAQATGGWQSFTAEKLDAELARGSAVFIDFTAAWCITCKFNEATVLESDAVREAFQRRRIVKFKADWTNADPAITKMLQQFGRPGVPLYVLYPAGRTADPIVFPELLTKNIVLEKLETVAARMAAK